MQQGSNMNREERRVFFKEVREAIRHGAPKPTLLAMLNVLPNDSEKAKHLRGKIKEML